MYAILYNVCMYHLGLYYYSDKVVHQYAWILCGSAINISSSDLGLQSELKIFAAIQSTMNQHMPFQIYSHLHFNVADSTAQLAISPVCVRL